MTPKPKRKRPTCPCGFIGSTWSIRAHRLACPAWVEFRETLTTRNKVQPVVVTPANPAS